MKNLNRNAAVRQARLRTNVRSDIVASIEVIMVVAAYVVVAMLTAMAVNIL